MSSESRTNLAEGATRIQQQALRYELAQKEREQGYVRFQGSIKKAFILIGIAAVFVAVLADILSFFDLGWLVTILVPLLPMLTGLIVRRIRSIERTEEQIVQAQEETVQQIKILRQRLHKPLAATNQMNLFYAIDALEVGQAVQSYIRKFVRDQIISQVLELIPVIDWLPMYTASAVKVLVDQRSAYRRAQRRLLPYREALDILSQLETFDIQVQLAFIGRAQALPPTVRRTAPSPQIPPPRQPMRDIRMPVALPAAA
jgi:hypothetical protein